MRAPVIAAMAAWAVVAAVVGCIMLPVCGLAAAVPSPSGASVLTAAVTLPADAALTRMFASAPAPVPVQQAHVAVIATQAADGTPAHLDLHGSPSTAVSSPPPLAPKTPQPRAHLIPPSTAQFVAKATVGGQDMLLIVDTGSTTTAVASAECTSCHVDHGFVRTATTKLTHMRANGIYGDNSSWHGCAGDTLWRAAQRLMLTTGIAPTTAFASLA